MLKRASTIGALFLLVACSSPEPCPKWTSLKINNPDFPSERWTYPSLPDYTGLTLEYTCYPSSDLFFLNLPYPLPDDESEAIDILFNSPEGDIEIQGTLFEGKQRISLPSSINGKIFEALESGSPFTFTVKNRPNLTLRIHEP